MFKKYIWCMYIFFMVAINFSTDAQTFDYLTAIKEAAIADNMIQTVKGKMNLSVLKSNSQTDYATNNSISYIYEHIGNILRIDMKDNINKTKLTISYDGEKTVTYNMAVDEKGLIHPSASISDQQLSQPLVTPFGFGYYLFRNDISDVLRKKSLSCGDLQVKNIKYIKSELIDKYYADKFIGDSSDNKEFAFWLTKELLYRPVKIITSGYEFNIKYTLIDSIYFPEQVIIAQQKTTNNENYSSNNITKIDYIIDGLIINSSINKNEFVIEMPKGMQVDDIRKR